MREIWSELGPSMRALRQAAGLSLRQVETRSGWGRGMLSQAETGRARPSRALVEWYDRELHGGGLLVRTYLAARTADIAHEHPRRDLRVSPEDALEVVGGDPARGQAVRPGDRLDAGWRLRDAGPVAWTGRRLVRAGAAAGAGLLAGESSLALPDCAPGETIEVRTTLTVPDTRGMVVAYWDVVDADGCSCFPGQPPLSVVVLVTSGEAELSAR